MRLSNKGYMTVKFIGITASQGHGAARWQNHVDAFVHRSIDDSCKGSLENKYLIGRVLRRLTIYVLSIISADCSEEKTCTVLKTSARLLFEHMHVDWVNTGFLAICVPFWENECIHIVAAHKLADPFISRWNCKNQE